MALTKVLSSSSLVIKLENGVDSKGNLLYKSKSFSNLKTEADIENIHAVATAISSILEKQTKDYSLRENSTIRNI